MSDRQIFILLDGVTANSQSNTTLVSNDPLTIEAFIKGSGTVSGTVTWYGCNTNRTSQGVVFATSTLSGTTTDQTSEICTSVYPFIYCILTSISGTGAVVSANVSQ
jgi:hypothetical protein